MEPPPASLIRGRASRAQSCTLRRLTWRTRSHSSSETSAQRGRVAVEPAVVDEDVQAAEDTVALGEQRRDALGRRHVGGVGVDVGRGLAELGRGPPGGATWSRAVDEDPAALLEETAGGGEADAPARAGDDRPAGPSVRGPRQAPSPSAGVFFFSASSFSRFSCRATSRIMSSCPPTTRRRPSSMRMSRGSRPTFFTTRKVWRRKLEYTPA